jgi:hypothetical protein
LASPKVSQASQSLEQTRQAIEERKALPRKSPARGARERKTTSKP